MRTMVDRRWMNFYWLGTSWTHKSFLFVWRPNTEWISDAAGVAVVCKKRKKFISTIKNHWIRTVMCAVAALDLYRIAWTLTVWSHIWSAHALPSLRSSHVSNRSKIQVWFFFSARFARVSVRDGKRKHHVLACWRACLYSCPRVCWSVINIKRRDKNK